MAKSDHVNTKVEETTPVKVDSPLPKLEAKVESKKITEQQKKELVFRLLWQASRLVKGATNTEILNVMPTIREWVGNERASALEVSWRLGKAIS